DLIDLQTGEELSLDIDLRQGNPSYLNCEVIYASTSTMKVPIMVNFFRYLDWYPAEGSDDYKNLIETMTRSGNVSANAMLLKIGGGFGAPAGATEYMLAGARSTTELVQDMGMENTFVVSFYDDEEDPEYYSTPGREAARSGQCPDTRADLYMQTTTSDMAVILNMIYQCAENGGGGLIAAFPDELTPDECQMMIDLMSQNTEGQLIMAGVPESVKVAHKHGWTYDTHGDSGIVFTPGGDYVLSMFLWADVEWLNVQISFPLMEGISQAAFNYFNPDLILEPRRGLGLELGIEG
ncbi:MAG: serine hydrolase, partial [Saprospiraceae bacterium]|nr:serine hydrolase [Saprospiraceae bacterium]